MKLVKDFGVRALLATIATVGFVAGLILALMSCDTIDQMVQILLMAQSPCMLALGFYFAKKATE